MRAWKKWIAAAGFALGVSALSAIVSADAQAEAPGWTLSP